MRLAAALGVSTALLAMVAPLRAQVVVQGLRDDVPVIHRVVPAGLQPGSEVELLLHGERLEGLHSVLGPPGVHFTEVLEVEPKRARVKLAVSADAAHGFFPLHVLCKAGLSNPRLVEVDPLPQYIEAREQQNNSCAEGTPVQLPVSINGVLLPGDVDHFRFRAAAGERIVFDAQSHRIGSALRPVLTLFDAAGRELATTLAPPPDIAPDVRLVHTFPSAGEYVIRLSDLTYQGNESCAYRLRIGPLPFATSMFPLGGQRGTEVTVTLGGGTLPTPIDHQFSIESDTRRRFHRLFVPYQDTTLMSPALFAIGVHPEMLEEETNDDEAEANTIDLPMTVNGRIGTPGDRDCYRLGVSSGQRLLVRVLAQQLGSPLDAIVTIRDSAGNVVASGDDRSPLNFQAPVVRPASPIEHLSDPLVEFSPPAEGQYVVAIEDLHGRGGPEYAYRVEVAQRPVDFQLIVQPGRAPPQRNRNRAQAQAQQVLQQFSGQGTGALSLDLGGSGTMVVRALREGYDGPIRLAVEGLPEGIEVGEAVIPSGQTQAVINFNVDFDVTSAAGFARIIGTAADGQTTLTRVARQPVVLSALPPNGAVEQYFDRVAVGVSRQGAELALRARLRSPVVQGAPCVLEVQVRRRKGYSGEVAVQIPNLPSGLQAQGVTIPADKEEALVELTADLDLTPGRRLIQIQGTMPKKEAKEPIVATFPVVLHALPVVDLAVADEQIEIGRGKKTAVTIVVTRNGARRPAVQLMPVRLPRGITAGKSVIAEDVMRFSLQLQAGPTARPSPVRRIVQIKAQVNIDGKTLELPSLRFALKVTR